MLKKISQFIDSQGPSAPSEKGMKTPKSQVIGDSFNFLSLIRSWKQIAGEKFAEHTIPLKNQNGTLVILSNHSVFANELSYHELLLKQKIFVLFPELEKSIKNIKFIVDSTHFDKQYEQFVTLPSKNKDNVQQIFHKHSPEFKRLKKEAESMFAEIEDTELKEQMISLFIQSAAAKAR